MDLGLDLGLTINHSKSIDKVTCAWVPSSAETAVMSQFRGGGVEG